MNPLLTVLIENASEEDLRIILANVSEEELVKAVGVVLGLPIYVAPSASMPTDNCPVEEPSVYAKFMAEKVYGMMNYATTPENACRIALNVLWHLKHDRKVEGVKYVRETTGCGLKMGLDFVNFINDTENR